MATNGPAAGGRISAMQKATLAIGVVFVFAGVLGFIPGITVGYDAMTFAGHHSGALLVGLFKVSILHNIVHLLYGVAGILASRSFAGARVYLIAGGISYLLLVVYGLTIDHGSRANFVPLNNADNWLHLGLGIAMVSLGVLLARPKATP
jgi:hypothetical protein